MSIRDFTSSLPGLALACLTPGAALVGAMWLDHPAKTLVWVVALAWMGVACLLNARRCGRTHCFFTGPFFLVMAVGSLLHGYGVLPLGEQGWRWLGLAVGSGAAALWVASEALLGQTLPGRRKGAAG